jgi:hypothetical protein
MAVASLGLFWSQFRRAGVATGVKRVRTFKNESKTIPIQIGTGGSRWLRLTSASLEGGPGLACRVNQFRSGASELVITPSLAGRTEGLKVMLKATDQLGLFTKQRTLELDFVLESLPLALRRAPLRLQASPRSFGENPAGRSGSGQELYAVSEYELGLDPHDIMWRRVAGMTDETLPVRIREANVRKVVSIGIRGGASPDRNRPRDNLLLAPRDREGDRVELGGARGRDRAGVGFGSGCDSDAAAPAGRRFLRPCHRGPRGGLRDRA